MTADELRALLRETEAEIVEALRVLAEVGNADALRASADTRAKHAHALAQLEHAQAQLERLGRVLDDLSEPRH